MFCVIRQYTLKSPAVLEELVSKAREEFVPIVSKAPGFASFTIGSTSDGEIVTTSFFKDRAGADESVKLARDWVRDNVAQHMTGPPRVTAGEVLFHKRHMSGDHGFGVIRRIRLKDGAFDETLRMMQAKLLPVLAEAPGFMSMLAMNPGNGELISIGRYRDRASAEEATRRATAFVAQNAAHLMTGPPEMIDAEIKLRHVNEANFG